jgi:hypothetical protein
VKKKAAENASVFNEINPYNIIAKKPIINWKRRFFSECFAFSPRPFFAGVRFRAEKPGVQAVFSFFFRNPLEKTLPLC